MTADEIILRTLFLLLFAIGLYHCFRTFVGAFLIPKWPSIEGEVTHTEIKIHYRKFDFGMRYVYEIYLRYQFEVAEKKYTGDRFCFDQEQECYSDYPAQINPLLFEKVQVVNDQNHKMVLRSPELFEKMDISRNFERAQEIIQRYHQEKKITIYYNPKNPAESYRKTGLFYSSNIALALIGTVLLLYLSYAMFSSQFLSTLGPFWLSVIYYLVITLPLQILSFLAG